MAFSCHNCTKSAEVSREGWGFIQQSPLELKDGLSNKTESAFVTESVGGLELDETTIGPEPDVSLNLLREYNAVGDLEERANNLLKEKTTSTERMKALQVSMGFSSENSDSVVASLSAETAEKIELKRKEI